MTRVIEDREVCSKRLKKCGQIRVMFDTGATHSLIRKAVLDRDFPGIPTETVLTTITMADGRQETKEVGVVDLMVEVEKNKPPIAAHFHVMDNLKEEAIIGANEMETNKIKVEMRPEPQPSTVKYIEGKPAGIEVGGVEIHLVDRPSVLRGKKMLALRHGRR